MSLPVAVDALLGIFELSGDFNCWFGFLIVFMVLLFESIRFEVIEFDILSFTPTILGPSFI